MENIKLSLTVAQVNTCFNALGQMPFKLVSALILKIENEATPQLKNDKDKKQQDIVLTLSLTLEDVNGVLDALGEMPFNEVKDVIIDIQNQAYPQLEKEPPDPSIAKALKKAEEKAEHGLVEPRDG